ncbi:pentatricopeptide repeat-containing protein At5g56310-like [Ananas comosus]|uniref:Pentatricopeptide repeat-containing protein At5g56310-like n=1 Tax=Ananas comosus TaxID=4615 RepID=A0A6P5EMS2_ANACO|nr:pentatricopeptide repeat-containing protein At5g56310-like [Ananas comosus]XP_020082665.1 pentatricopeptide repeat-containing protein At5g56310-like [Ananas comosus]
MRLRHHLPLRSLSFSPLPPPSPAKKNPTHSPIPLHHLLSLLSRSSTLPHLAQIHGHILPRGLDRDNLLLGKLVHGASLLGFVDYAFSIFKHQEDPDTYLHNTMIRGLSQNGSSKDAIFIFNSIQVVGLRPDTYSFPFVLKAIAHLGMLELGREVHSQVIRIGLGSDIHISTGLIHTYCNCGGIDDARQLFDGIIHRDVVLWNVMIAGYAKVGDLDNARVLFDRMPERNVVSWTTMIGGYARLKLSDEAIALFRKMQVEDGIEPDEISLLAVLSACSDLGALDLGEWIHSLINKRGLYKTVPLMNALMDMYAKCGDIARALEVFEKMKNRSVVTWSTMIAGFALNGLGVEALEVFHRMERENVEPNDVTFLAILSACSHIGKTNLGHRYFDCMKSRYRIKPKIEHYGCMVDLLGRAGCLKEAYDLVQNMPFEANEAIWGALLAASRIYGDVGLGEKALVHLIELEPHNSGNYILLSNIYAAQERWDDVRKLRKLMKDRGVKTMPGASSIELDGAVHEFTSRDGSHPCLNRIFEVLCDISRHLRMAGYVPNICGVPFDFE